MKRKTLRLKELEHNRYSILTKNLTRCFICNSPKQDLHEIFEGPRRIVSMKCGLVIPVCRNCHFKLHHDNNFALKYKQLGQSIYEKNHTREQFINIFKRNYL